MDIISSHLTWMRGGYSPRTVEDAGKLLRRVDRDLRPWGLKRASHEELAGWLAQQARGRDGKDWAPNTRDRYRKDLVRFYRWAVREVDPWLDWDPSVGLPRPIVARGVPRPATDIQTAAAVTRVAWPWRLHCTLAAYAGLRPIEIADLRREDVTDTDLYVRQGKGGKPAVLPTHPAVWDALAGLPPGPVSTTPAGRPVTARWVSISTARRLRDAGLPITLRSLRHWYGTTLLDRCGDLRVVQELMRHESVSTTQVYTQVVERKRRAAVGQLPVLTAAAGGGGGAASHLAHSA